MLRQPALVSPAWRRALLGYAALAAMLAACVDVPARTRVPDEGSAEDVGADFERPTDGAPDAEPSDRGPLPDAAPDLAIEADMAPMPDMARVEPDMAEPDRGPEPDAAVVDAEVQVDEGVPVEELWLLADGMRIEGEAFSLGAVPIGSTLEQDLAVANAGATPIQLQREVRIVHVEGAGVASSPVPAQELRPQEELPLTLTFTPEASGPVQARLTLTTARGTEVSATFSAVGIRALHVAAGAGRLAASQTLGQLWSSTEVPGGLGADVEVACAPCPEAGMPLARADARCVAVGAGVAGGVAYATTDGEAWPAADFGPQPPPLLAVDYGPPWVALDNGGRIWRSDNGRVWARAPVVLDIGQSRPISLAANHLGDIMVIGTEAGWWYAPAVGEPTFNQAEANLLRVASAPDGSFTAVGESLRWLQVSADGAITSTNRFEGQGPATDITYGDAFGTRGWLALVGGAIWSRPDGGDWGLALPSAVVVERFALGAGGFVGGSAGSIHALPHGADDWAPRADAPAGLAVFAAFTVCTGGAEPVEQPEQP